MEGNKMNVVYCGKIWELDSWINKSIFGEYVKKFPRQKILISQNGTTLSVEIRHLKLELEPEVIEIPLEKKKKIFNSFFSKRLNLW